MHVAERARVSGIVVGDDLRFQDIEANGEVPHRRLCDTTRFRVQFARHPDLHPRRPPLAQRFASAAEARQQACDADRAEAVCQQQPQERRTLSVCWWRRGRAAPGYRRGTRFVRGVIVRW